MASRAARRGRLPVNAPRIAVLVPCFNEAATIATVVRDFLAALPQATVYVYDNNSTDGTAAVARAAGATVRREPMQGKGSVVRRMFADVEADAYVLVDGDSTYDAASVTALVERLLSERLDMVVAVREAITTDSFRSGHAWGNRVLSHAVSSLFGSRVSDMLSGYRVMSRRFVKSLPALATGFEIETELTVHALMLRMPVAEQRTPYRARPADSSSKLRTYRDGWRILVMILRLLKDERPLAFFTAIFVVLSCLSLGLAYPIVVEYLVTGLVPRFPTAILATGVMLLAFLSLSAGFILDNVTRGRRELKRLGYLAIPGPSSDD
ncbi:MAG: glycosyltransferase [Alphaproteobacteria bacterium]|nr:glycosyltransferase [Alphaproteobacteria bacterium]